MTEHKIQGIAFDWGDTLMKLYPQYSGAMSEWPEVAAVDGAVETLQRLSGRYRLFVATNAVDSNAGQINDAFKRVGLDTYFERIFTYHQLGSRKPDRAYFDALAGSVDIPAQRMLMVGDTYIDDITGPKAAGWKAIWLNPGHHAAPGLLPLQDAGIAHLSDLDETIEHLTLPDYPTCVSMLIQSGASHNLIQHVSTVAAAAYQFSLWLQSNRIEVDPILAHRGGLLHDLGKMKALRLGEKKNDHGQMGAQLLMQSGLPQLADVAQRHLLFAILDSSSGPQTWEQKLVYFADKLAEGSRLVTVQERITALKNRYHIDNDLINRLMPALLGLQEQISSAIKMTPDEWFTELKENLRGS